MRSKHAQRNIVFECADAKDQHGADYFIVGSFMPHGAPKAYAIAVCNRVNKVAAEAFAELKGSAPETPLFTVTHSEKRDCYVVQATHGFTPEHKDKALTAAADWTMTFENRVQSAEEMHFRRKFGADREGWQRRN